MDDELVTDENSFWNYINPTFFALGILVATPIIVFTPLKSFFDEDFSPTVMTIVAFLFTVFAFKQKRKPIWFSVLVSVASVVALIFYLTTFVAPLIEVFIEHS